MTITTNARVAGFTFWIYFARRHWRDDRWPATYPRRPCSTWSARSRAMVLGVTLYAITRGQDRDLAMMGLACRVIEAVPGHGEIYFAVGSTIFSWLLLRGRMIPAGLAWLGVVASAFLVLLLPMQIAGYFGGPRAWSSPVTWAVWLPMLVYELTLAVWLITKGVAVPARRDSHNCR